jgi:Holliday junction resolvase-like predicted endonuclease
MENPDNKIKIKKNTGELVDFDEEKLKNSLRRSGAREEDINRVLHHILGILFNGITTKKIYQIAYQVLHKQSHHAAGRFRLKKALYQMGPSGYPFERFVARLLEYEGYNVETGKIVQGRCVNHEVDVIARKKGKIIMGECKFHHSDNAKSDVKVSLYVRSRFSDIKEKWLENPENRNVIFEPLLITNTRFTLDAEQYGECSGLKVVSWDYPKGNSLKDWIDRSGFHPVTSIKALRIKEKRELLDNEIVLCRDLVNKADILDRLNISTRRKNSIIKEAKALGASASVL